MVHDPVLSSAPKAGAAPTTWSDLAPLAPERVGEAAALAAAAFLHSPGYCYIFEGLSEAKRLEALTWLFRKNFALRLPEGTCRCGFKLNFRAEPGGGGGARAEMVCAFMLQLPGTPGISAWVMVKHGILSLPLRYGLRALRRLLEVMEHHEAVEEAVRAANPGVGFSALERMVVKPGAQGQGLGSRFLGQALAVEARAGRALLLSTQEARNVAFYARFGFTVLHEGPYFRCTQRASGGAPAAAGATPVTVYTMVRAPSGTSLKTPAEMPEIGSKEEKAGGGLGLWVVVAFVAALAVVVASQVKSSFY